jgi:hypothetical protein
MAGTYTEVNLTVDVTEEKLDLLTILNDQRGLLKVTVQGITDEQARQKTTVSDLTLGGLIKHITIGTRGTAKELVERDETAEFDMSTVEDVYTFTEADTVEHWLSEFDSAAAEFDRVIAEVDSMDELIPQATAPWAPERVWWTVRRVVLHQLREIAHHSGHADIIREALDGQSTMAAISEDVDWSTE